MRSLGTTILVPQPLYKATACGRNWFATPRSQIFGTLVPALHRTMTPREPLLDSVYVRHGSRRPADEYWHVNKHTRSTIAQRQPLTVKRIFAWRPWALYRAVKVLTVATRAGSIVPPNIPQTRYIGIDSYVNLLYLVSRVLACSALIPRKKHTAQVGEVVVRATIRLAPFSDSI